MTCRDCIHYDVCGGYTPTDLDQDVFDYCREGKADEIPDIEKRCGSFKNKADFVEVVRCKDCVWFVPEHIKLSDGTTRPCTDEEKKMPCGVTSDIGINVGSYCLRKGYWKQNSIPVWFQENDFCSYGERSDT